MSYSTTIGLTLGPAQTGLSLRAQLKDTTGTNVGSLVSAGFFVGNYGWIQTASSKPLWLNKSGNGVILGGTTSAVGFYGNAGVTIQTLPTGAGKTVDDVILALQFLNLVKQS